jgi:hypothetical protein
MLLTEGQLTIRFTISGGGKMMQIFFFRVKVTATAEPEVEGVAAPDFLRAVETLAAWRPGIHIVKLEGIHNGSPGYA